MNITQRVRVDNPETGESVILQPGRVPSWATKLISNPNVIEGESVELEMGDRPGPAMDEVQVSENLVEFGYIDDGSGEFVAVAESPQQFEIADRPDPEFDDSIGSDVVIFDRPDGEVAEISAHGDEQHPLHGLRVKDDFVTFASLNDIDLGDAKTVPEIKAAIEAAIDQRTSAAAAGVEVIEDHPDPAPGAEPETPAAGEPVDDEGTNDSEG